MITLFCSGTSYLLSLVWNALCSVSKEQLFLLCFLCEGSLSQTHSSIHPIHLMRPLGHSLLHCPFKAYLTMLLFMTICLIFIFLLEYKHSESRIYYRHLSPGVCLPTELVYIKRINRLVYLLRISTGRN